MAVVRYTQEKIEEVQDAAHRLGLSNELKEWSCDDVQKWILWAIREFYSQCLDLLEVDGKELNGLNLAEFQRRIPSLYIFFYNELQIWKTATSEKQENSFEPSNSSSPSDGLEIHTPIPDQPTVTNDSGPKHKNRDETNINIPATISDITEEEDNDNTAGPGRNIDNDNQDRETLNNSTHSAASSVSSRQSMEYLAEKMQHKENALPLVSPHTLLHINSMPSSAGPLLNGSNPFFGNPKTDLTPTISMPSSASDFLPSNFHYPFSSAVTGAPHGGLISPVSPHILGPVGHRPRLMIPPPPGFTLPYQLSPCLTPNSPFGSPMMSPNIQSPLFSSFPRMEALRENIKRLEKERQKRAKSLTNKPTGAKRGRKKKVKDVSTDNINLNRSTSSSNVSMDSPFPISSGISLVTTPSISVTSPHNSTTNIQFPFKVKVENVDSDISPEMFIDKNANRMPYYYHKYGHNSEQSPQGIHIPFNSPMANANHTTNKNDKLLPVTNKAYIKTEPGQIDNTRKDDSCKGVSTSNSVAVQHNSCEIPYYQATSLKSLERTSSMNNLTVSDLPSISSSQYASSSIIAENGDSKIKCNQSQSSPSPRLNNTRDSYSPITSPSDTEVELPSGEHIHRQFFQHQNSLDTSNCISHHPLYRSISFPGSSHLEVPPNGPLMNHGLPLSHEIMSSMLPSVLPFNDSADNTSSSTHLPNNQNSKVARKRGRPPGTKPMARPLGPSDIQKSLFRANHLWKFLLEMLEEPVNYGRYIQWLDRPNGVFKIMKSSHVASLWGTRKNNGRMTYEKFSRAIRQYYKKGIIVKTQASKLIYKFGAEFFDPNGE